MSRIPDYDDEPFPNAGELFQHRITQAINGKRGQALLKELEAALVAMPVKRLLYSGFCDKAGEVCTLGALGVKREMDKGKTREEALKYLWGVVRRRGIEKEEENFGPNGDSIRFAAKRLDMAFALAWEVISQNDERNGGYKTTPEQRYEAVLKWVREQIHPPGYEPPKRVKPPPPPPPPAQIAPGQQQVPGFEA